jgi:hypothetical protein
MSRATTNSK